MVPHDKKGLAFCLLAHLNDVKHEALALCFVLEPKARNELVFGLGRVHRLGDVPQALPRAELGVSFREDILE
jgi:hypothetical protein